MPKDPVANRIGTTEQESDLLDVNEVSKLYRVASQTLANWRCRGGGPPFTKLGRSVYYSKRDVDAWVESNKRNPAAA